MSKYDKILKQEKVFREPIVKKSKYTKYIIIYCLLFTMLLITSYIIYYNTVLSPINIIKNDFTSLAKNLENIYQNIIPSQIDASLEGTITSDKLNYNYGLIKEGNNYYLDLSTKDSSLQYQITPKMTKTNLSTFQNNRIIKENKIDYSKLKNTLNTFLKEEKYIKTFYFDKKTPIVEINFTLTDNDINSLFHTTILKEKYNIIITLKNDALKNETKSIKVVVNNKNKNQRSTFEYQNQSLIYQNFKNEKYKFILVNNQKDFNMKIYKNEELYSILLGKSYEKSYTMTYQIINKIYNISLTKTEEKSLTTYKIVFKKEEEESKKEDTINIALNQASNTLKEETESKEKTYRSLNQSEKTEYNEKIKQFFAPLKELINEYRPKIDNLDS